MSTDDQARNMAQAHADGLHADLPREGCPECQDQELSSHPRTADVKANKKKKSWPIA